MQMKKLRAQREKENEVFEQELELSRQVQDKLTKKYDDIFNELQTAK